MARFFIDRPVFAIVIAIVIVILGVVAIPNLPIAAFPEVVPPVIQITASYLGGNSIDLEKTVAQPIEEQLAGLDGMHQSRHRHGSDPEQSEHRAAEAPAGSAAPRRGGEESFQRVSDGGGSHLAR
jgi:Cu/Ag efflux pump CusA